MTMSTVGVLTSPRMWMDEVAADCKSCAVGVILFGAVVYTDAGIGGVAVAIGRDLILLDKL